jgi:hypothetical protein
MESRQYRTIRIDDEPEAVRRFFEKIGDQVTLVEVGGKPICVLYPSYELAFTPEGQLKDAMGAWDLPLDIALAISNGLCEGETPP